jgi:hypothetical protein
MTGPRSAQVATWAAGVLVCTLGLSLCQAGQEKSPEAPKRRSVHNLKQIALALRYYTDSYARLPAAASLDPAFSGHFGNPLLTADQLIKSQGKLKGKALPLVSWRVALLPFLEEGTLHKEYKVHEPWDSEHNKRLLAKMPKVYQPVTGKAEGGLTYYQVFVGKDTPFDGMVPSRFPASFPDGLARTFLVVEGGEAVPWTKPQDIPYDARKAVPKLGGLFADGFHAAMADGTVRFVPRGADEKAIRAAITPRGGEFMDLPGKEVKLK